MLVILALYLKSFFYFTFKVNSCYFDAFETLYRGHSFRVPDSLMNDRLIGFRYLIKSLRLGFKSNLKIKNFQKQLIFDGDKNQKDDRIKYLSSVLEISDLTYISRDNFKKIPIVKFVFFLILFSPVFSILIFLTLISNKRQSIALSILSLTELFLLKETIDKKSVEKVYYFYPFENDANFFAIILIKYGIEVIKIPGPNTLNRFHIKLIASEVSLCSQYQIEQANELKNKWYVSKVNLWPLYRFQDLIEYKNKLTSYKHKIGFISSGIWRRKELKMKPFEKGDYTSEITLLSWLQKYISTNMITTFFIYLHPIEKVNDEIHEASKAFYSNLFPNVEIKFNCKNIPSYESFNESEITISSQSTANIQRLFLGYKAMFTPMNFSKTVFGGTSLDAICFYNYNSFSKGLDEILNLSEENYFKNFQLYKYRWDNILSQNH